MTLEDDVLKRITPNSALRKKALATVSEVMAKIAGTARKLGIDVEPILVGSVAKDTALSVTDIDIFIMFPVTTSLEDLQKNGLKLGESVVKGERRYAQHPYTHGEYKGFTLDIVPCYRVESPTQKMSAVDRTPFHTEYVKNNLREEQKREVRLLKQFLKGIGAYGAEIEIEGFSGYLCEVLVLRFGTFENVLASARRWHKGTFIKLNDATSPKFEDTLIAVDPVDPSRNAAAAVSTEKMSRVIHAADEYLKKRKVEFFFPNEPAPLSLSRITGTLDERGTELMGLSIEKPDVVDDVLFSQVKKCEKAVAQLCESYGFRVCASAYIIEGKRILFLFEFEIFRLPKLAVHIGPPLWHPNSQDFISTWENKDKFAGPYILMDRWAVDTRREFTTAPELVRAKLGQAGLGKNISEKIARGKFKVLSRKELVKSGNVKFLSRFFDKRFPWEH